MILYISLYLNITALPFTIISPARDLVFPARLSNISCELPRGSKILEILEPFRKFRDSKASEIFDMEDATKNI